MARRSINLSLQSYFTAIVALAVLPVLIFSVAVTNRLLRDERETSERLLRKTADELALAFDQEVVSTIRTLEAISRSVPLREQEWRSFHRQLSEILRSQPTWSSILLHSANGDWLLNARLPFGQRLGPALEPDSLRELSLNAKPTVSKLIRLPPELKTDFTHAFAIRVPVLNGKGKVVYILSAVISTNALHTLVQRFSQAPGESVRAIVDPEGILGARSRSPEKFVGAPASETLRNLFKESDHGLHSTFTLEGERSYSSYRRAPVSGWYAAVAVPRDYLDATARQTHLTVILAGVFILFLSGLTAFYFSRWLKKSIRAGANGAATLARGRTPQIPNSRIRELEELRSSLLTASDLLRSRDKAKGEFLANMSHELRTPLGVVLGVTDLLSKEKVPPADRSRSWEIVKRNGQQLLRLIDDIRDFSKIEANRLVIEKIDFSLPDLASSIVEEFSPRTLEKGVDLRLTKVHGSPTIINSDPVRVRQILSNLISNAVKFTHGGSIEVRLLPYDNDLVRITVTDSGIGLSEEQQKQLFNDFTQGDNSHTRKYGGTGLGLSLSRKISHLLGGEVRLMHSHPGKGSAFEITFQANAAAPLHIEGASLSEGSAHASEAPCQIPPGTKILLAEDSPDNVVWIEAYLKDCGADVSVAENGLEALDKARAKDFDLILMDIQMPEMDGYEATRRLREEGMTMPIIALTAHALNEHRTKALQIGFTDFLTKPVQHEALLRTVEKNLH